MLGHTGTRGWEEKSYWGMIIIIIFSENEGERPKEKEEVEERRKVVTGIG